MKSIKTRLLLAFLSPLILSFTSAKIAEAGSSTHNFRNGNYITLTCSINSDQFKVITTTGKLGNIISHNLSIQSNFAGMIKKVLPVDQNGNINFTTTVRTQQVDIAFIFGNIKYSDGYHPIRLHTHCS